MNKAINTAVAFVILIWLIYLVSLFIPLQQYGLIPRTLSGAKGIITAPFLHASWSHLIGNSTSFAGLVIILILLEGDRLIKKLLLMMLIGGSLTWLFARPANHIGASGLIFSMWSYILLSAWFSKKISYILLSIPVILLYGGMIYGILPLQSHISWEGHFFGLITGVFLAWFYHKKRISRRK